MLEFETLLKVNYTLLQKYRANVEMQTLVDVNEVQ